MHHATHCAPAHVPYVYVLIAAREDRLWLIVALCRWWYTMFYKSSSRGFCLWLAYVDGARSHKIWSYQSASLFPFIYNNYISSVGRLVNTQKLWPTLFVVPHTYTRTVSNSVSLQPHLHPPPNTALIFDHAINDSPKYTLMLFPIAISQMLSRCQNIVGLIADDVVFCYSNWMSSGRICLLLIVLDVQFVATPSSSSWDSRVTTFAEQDLPLFCELFVILFQLLCPWQLTNT